MILCEIVPKACTRMATAKRKGAILIQAYIRNMTGEQYLAAIAREPSVIIPTGSCEIYGPHLPMGTDLLAAQGIAERIAQRTGFLIAPAIETGESSALSAFPCTFAMPRHILEDYLDFLVGKLVSDGVKRIVFLTGHAGNVDTVSYIAKKYLHTHGLQSCQIDWWRFARTHSDGILTNTGSMAHGHASECGTSVMLHIGIKNLLREFSGIRKGRKTPLMKAPGKHLDSGPLQSAGKLLCLCPVRPGFHLVQKDLACQTFPGDGKGGQLWGDQVLELCSGEGTKALRAVDCL